MISAAPYLIVFIFLFYPIVEGLREYYYYGVNKAARFSQRTKDSDRKTMNVLTWVLCHCLPVIYLSGNNWLLAVAIAVALAFWRWVALDGVLNVKRGLGFWYAGNSGRSFTDKILYPLPVITRATLKISPLIALLVFILWYSLLE